MNKRRIKFMVESTIVVLMLYIAIIAWFTPTAVAAAYASRGYFAIGGEWTPLLTVPFALLGIRSLYAR